MDDSARVRTMVSLAVFRLIAIDLHAFEKNVVLLITPSTGELDERGHLPVERTPSDPLFGMVVNTIPLEDALTLLRESEMLDALRDIEKNELPASGRWAMVVTETRTAILGFSAEVTENDKKSLAAGFKVADLAQVAASPTDFQAWSVRQLERDLPKLIRRHPTFADENQRDTLVCAIASGSVLDELLHPEVRALQLRRGGDAASCFPTHVARVLHMLARYAAADVPMAFSSREAEETAASIRTQLAAVEPGQLVGLICRGKHIAVTRFSWVLEDFAGAVPAPSKGAAAETMVNAKGGQC